MTNAQLFLAIGVPMAFNGALLAALWRHVDVRFTSVDNQLKFLLDHMVNHAERIATLEAKIK